MPITLNGTTGITTPGKFVADNMPAGSVLQVVQASTTTEVSNSTSTYADTTLTATITPRSATSTILVMVSQSAFKSSGNAANALDVKLFRDATDLGRVVYAMGYTNAATNLFFTSSFQFLDSPATTSATTYKTRFANNSNTALVKVQPDGSGTSTIVLMEIAA